MRADRTRQLLVLASFVFTVAVNGLANVLPFNGQTTAEISNRFAVFLTPAGYVFGIWGLIYLGQLGFVLHSLRPSRRADPILRRMGLWPVAVAVLNAVWIFLWHWEVYPATLVVMVAILLSLILLYRRAGFEALARPSGGLARAERWLVQLPFSIYLGWITVATIVNTAVVGQVLGLPTFGLAPQLIAALVLVGGLLLTVVVLLRTADLGFGAVIIWAYVGIAVKEAGTAWVPLVAAAGALIVAGLMLSALIRRAPPQSVPAG